MNELLKSIDPLIRGELDRANDKFPQFASSHEGYAVLLEEVEETKEEMSRLEVETKFLWQTVRGNNPFSYAEDIKRTATNLAAEAIQVAAMAQKFIDMMEREEK